jgi:hypothetical protein
MFVFNPIVEVVGYSVVKKQVKKYGKIKSYKGGKHLWFFFFISVKVNKLKIVNTFLEYNILIRCSFY